MFVQKKMIIVFYKFIKIIRKYMSNIYTRYTCKKLQNNQYPNINPTIAQVSSYLDEVYQQTVVTVLGTNFRYFSIINLGNISLNIIYISSNLISFNVPRNLPSGLYSLSVVNDSISSN